MRNRRRIHGDAKGYPGAPCTTLRWMTGVGVGLRFSSMWSRQASPTAPMRRVFGTRWLMPLPSFRRGSVPCWRSGTGWGAPERAAACPARDPRRPGNDDVSTRAVPDDPCSARTKLWCRPAAHARRRAVVPVAAVSRYKGADLFTGASPNSSLCLGNPPHHACAEKALSYLLRPCSVPILRAGDVQQHRFATLPAGCADR